MTAVLRYEVDAVTQNGNHEVPVVPDDLPAMPGSLVHPVKPRAATVAYEGARGTLHLSFARLRLCVHRFDRTTWIL